MNLVMHRASDNRIESCDIYVCGHYVGTIWDISDVHVSRKADEWEANITQLNHGSHTIGLYVDKIQ